MVLYPNTGPFETIVKLNGTQILVVKNPSEGKRDNRQLNATVLGWIEDASLNNVDAIPQLQPSGLFLELPNHT